MKICMLIAGFPPTIGGTEIQCFRLSAWLASHGHRVVVLTERSDPGQSPRERIKDIDVIRFRVWGSTRLSSLIYALQAWVYLLVHDRFDILHAHMIATPALVALATGRLRSMPVLTKIAGGRATGDFGTSLKSLQGKIKLWIFRSTSSWVVCPNKDILEEARGFGIRADRLKYIPNGVDTAYFKPAESRQPRPPTAIYVGRWAKGKGVETILDLWEAGVSDSNFPWRLILVLSETPPQPIARRIAQLKSHAILVIAGDPLPYYQASDLAVLFSEGEGMSNFLLEAMSCGLPTMTTSAAALPDAEGEKTGTCTLSAGDQTVHEALRIMAGLSQDHNRVIALGRAARRHIEERYALDRIGQSYISLYETMRG